MDGFREAIQWIIRLGILFIIGILIYKIYPINSFFVTIFGSIIFVFAIIIPEEKIMTDEDVLVVSKFFIFNLYRVKKVIRLDNVKNVIVAGNHHRTTNINEIIMPYITNGYSFNEIRIIFENGDIQKYRSAIYFEELIKLESKLNELIEEKNKRNSFSQPIYREE